MKRTRDTRKRREVGLRLIRPRYGFRRRAGVGRPHCPKCPARYEIMSARARARIRGNARITYPVHAPWNSSYLPLETRISVSVTHLSLASNLLLSGQISLRDRDYPSENNVYLSAIRSHGLSEGTLEKRLQDVSFVRFRSVCYMRS